MHSGNVLWVFVFVFVVPVGQIGNYSIFPHILCSCMRQYDCNDVLDGFGVQEMAVSTGRIQVAKQCQDKIEIFTSINFRDLGFIREYSENLYTTKISTYMVYSYSGTNIHMYPCLPSEILSVTSSLDIAHSDAVSDRVWTSL